MKNLKPQLILGAVLLCLGLWAGCQSYTPLYPMDRYQGLDNMAPAEVGVSTAFEGGYVLYVYRYDTIIGRQAFPIYKSTPQFRGQSGMATDSLFLYFLDDHRFYYSRKRLEELELTKNPRKKDRIGWYSVEEVGSDTLLILDAVAGQVDRAEAFVYSKLELLVRDGGQRLELDRALYPLTIQPRDPGSPRLPEESTEFLQASALGYHAEWVLGAPPMRLLWKDQPITHIRYDFGRKLRVYTLKNGDMIAEPLSPAERTSY
jgi:hypothetical protein